MLRPGVGNLGSRDPWFFINKSHIPIPDPRFSKLIPNSNPRSQIFKINPKSQSQIPENWVKSRKIPEIPRIPNTRYYIRRKIPIPNPRFWKWISNPSPNPVNARDPGNSGIDCRPLAQTEEDCGETLAQITSRLMAPDSTKLIVIGQPLFVDLLQGIRKLCESFPAFVPEGINKVKDFLLTPAPVWVWN